MPFKIPTFNAVYNVWHSPNVPPAAPDANDVCQLRPSTKHGFVTLSPSLGASPAFVGWELLVPAGSDLRDESQTGTPLPDVVEVPAGSGRYYWIVLADDVAKGFANEYRIGLLAKSNLFGLWPIPMP